MRKSLSYQSFLIAICILFSNCHAGAKVMAQKIEKPLNIILLIGDGMGLAQISAAAFMNGGLALELFKNIGLVKTASANNYITDSAAGATAYSTGEKTYNGAIGLSMDSMVLPTILEMSEAHGLSTGLIATCSITHATPAAFFGHQKNREMHKEIANDFYAKGIDYVAGSGKPYFDLSRLNANNYTVHTGKDLIGLNAIQKYFWFYNDSIDAPKSPERGSWLKQATTQGIEFLSSNKKGFFLMVEGSQIDWGGHENDLNYTVSELIDFDHAVRAALEFAQKDGNTLVLVTADHETGGLSLDAGSLKKMTIEHHYSSTHHSGIMVPIYAYGPGSELFTGTIENTDVFKKMKSLYGF
jgi:alkaline phosphatase